MRLYKPYTDSAPDLARTVTSSWKSAHLESSRSMKTIEKQFDAVHFMRQQRDQLSEKLVKMTKEEIVAYFKRQPATAVKPGS